MVDVTVVIATRDHRRSLLHTLAVLDDIPDRPPVVVVDNGSSDGSAAAVRTHHPRCTVLALGHNAGAVARNHGVRLARTRYVAFADDDSWWDPGALQRAQSVLDRSPDVAGVIGRVELHPHGGIDAVSRKMGRDLLGSETVLPGPRVLSFPAFAAVIRRDAFERVGGFSRLLFFGGEEELLAIDLAVAGRPLCYRSDVVARHAPGGAPVSAERWATQTRNDVLLLWLRRPLSTAVTRTASLVVRATHDRTARSALIGVLWRVPTALRQRRRVSRTLERDLRTAERPVAHAT